MTAFKLARISNCSSGSMLISTLLISAIVFMLVVIYNSIITNESRTTEFGNDAALALYVSDSGLKRGFSNLVSLSLGNTSTPNTFLYVKAYGIQSTISMYTSGSEVRKYSVTVYGNNSSVTSYRPVTGSFGAVTMMGGGGTYKHCFTIESLGWVERNGDIKARRTLMAKVLIHRGDEDADGFPVCGKIDCWYQKNR